MTGRAHSVELVLDLIRWRNPAFYCEWFFNCKQLMMLCVFETGTQQSVEVFAKLPVKFFSVLFHLKSFFTPTNNLSSVKSSVLRSKSSRFEINVEKLKSNIFLVCVMWGNL